MNCGQRRREPKSGLAFDVLTGLARDPIWFVRLRAIVSLGKLSDPHTIPALLRGLMDATRLVRLRAAEGIVKLKEEMAPIFAELEVIIVNDGSKDRTLEELREEFHCGRCGRCTSRRPRARPCEDCIAAMWTRG